MRIPWLKPLVCILAGLVMAGILHIFVFTQIRVTTTHKSLPLLAGDRLVTCSPSLIGPNYKNKLIIFENPITKKDNTIGICQAEGGDTVWIRWNETDTTRTHCERRPIVVPRSGQEMDITIWNKTLISNLLHLYEGRNVCPSCQENCLVIDGESTSKVTFVEDYVWIGSRMENGSDTLYSSHTFGPIPLSRIKSVAAFVSFSKEPATPFYKGYRWERFFRKFW